MVAVEFNEKYDKDYVAAYLSGDADDVDYMESLLLIGGWKYDPLSESNILIKRKNKSDEEE